MNEFLQMFKEEQKLLKKLKKKKQKSSSVFVSLKDNNTQKQNSKSNPIDSKLDIHSQNNIPYSCINVDNHKANIQRNSGGGGSSGSELSKTSSTKSSSHSISSGSGGIGGGGSIHFRSTSQNNYTSKGGVVVKNQSVVVKTNFEMSGRLNKNGKRPNSKEVGSHASASMNYIDNHGANDLESSETLSNTYHENGDRMTKEEFKELQSDLKSDTQAFRRIIIDVNQKDFTREDLNKLVRESMQQFKEDTRKDFEFKFALHFDTDQPHAHITAFGSNADINFTKEHLQNFKEIIGEKTEEITLEKELEHDRDLSLNQQIDKALDGVLDNKFGNDNHKGLTL